MLLWAAHLMVAVTKVYLDPSLALARHLLWQLITKVLLRIDTHTILLIHVRIDVRLYIVLHRLPLIHKIARVSRLLFTQVLTCRISFRIHARTSPTLIVKAGCRYLNLLTLEWRLLPSRVPCKEICD